jgi:hypothetical protein
MNGRAPLTALLSAAALLAAPGAAGAARAPAVSSAEACHYAVDHQVDRRVLMSEVHGWIGVDATFQYAAGRSADTYVGAAVQSPKGIWSAQGTDHVTNARVFGQTAKLNGRGDRRVTGVFKFNILKLRGQRCPKDAIKGYTRALRFEGGMRIEKGKGSTAPPGFSGRCNKTPGHRKLYPGTSVFTGTGRSFTYDRAFTIVGVTLGSSTTFSTNAQITLVNHGQRAVWVCGVNASRQPVPIADAVMLYAGPRARK